METYERINHYLEINKISKKEFVKRLLALEPRLKNTGEIPSESTIYAYLNGRIGIKVELIPYIAEVLNAPEQILFDDSAKTRKIYLKHILSTLLAQEREYLEAHICGGKKMNLQEERFATICDLLRYAPELFVKELEETLTKYKELTLGFAKK